MKENDENSVVDTHMDLLYMWDKYDLHIRTLQCLRRANITTIDCLISKTKEELLQVRNIGLIGYNETVDLIENKLKLSFKK